MTTAPAIWRSNPRKRAVRNGGTYRSGRALRRWRNRWYNDNDCPTAANEATAKALTRANIATIKHTLDLHVLLFDDGVAEFFPTIDTLPKLAHWANRALQLPDGRDFPFKDAWCRDFGAYSSDEATYHIHFASAGPDGKFGTTDDIPADWTGHDY